MRTATSRRSSIGVDVPPVTPTTRLPSKAAASSRSRAASIWIACVPAISHRRVSSLVLALTLLLDHPCAGAVDDLEPALLGALEDLGLDAVGANDDSGSVVDVVERLDAADAEVEQVLDDALVVHDLPEGVRGLARRGGLLG